LRNKDQEYNNPLASFSTCFKGCQLGFFEAKCYKCVFLKAVGDKKIVWLFVFNIWLFLEAVGTHYQSGVLTF